MKAQMKISRRKLIAAAVLLMTALTGTLAYAAYASSAKVANSFSSGGISIEAECFQEKDGRLVPAGELTVADLDSAVSYIPRITNRAEESYIRVRLEAESAGESIELMKELYGIGNSWKEAGGYMYRTEKLGHDETAELCRGFEIPKEWDYRKENRMKVRLVADAVQAKNIYPDFDSEAPWGDVAVERSELKGQYTVRETVPVFGQGAVKIVCDRSSGISVSEDHMFSEITDGVFMPGDEKSGSLMIRNDRKHKVKVFFKAVYDSSELSKSMQLRICSGKNDSDMPAGNVQTFYSGPMADRRLAEYRLIAELDAGEEKRLDITASLPSAADNRCQLKEVTQLWYFTVSEDGTAPDTGEPGSFSILLVLAALCAAVAAAAVFIIVPPACVTAGKKLHQKTETVPDASR